MRRIRIASLWVLALAGFLPTIIAGAQDRIARSFDWSETLALMIRASVIRKMRSLVPSGRLIQTARRCISHQLDPFASATLSATNKLIVGLIMAISVVETEPVIWDEWNRQLSKLDFIIGIAFAVEFGIRFWCAGEVARYRGFKGRLGYLVRPMTLIDLASFVPTLVTYGTTDIFLLRIARIGRLIRLGKFGRYTTSLLTIQLAIRRCTHQLVAAATLGAASLTFAAALLYFVERNVQPNPFGSVPRAMWWGVITMTTVGYGDVVPLTPLGKFLGAFAALTGIAIIALPTAIIAASFTQASMDLKRKRRTLHRARQRRAAKLERAGF